MIYTKHAQEKYLLDCLKHFEVWDFDVSREVPAEMHHRNDRLVALQLVPFIPGNSKLILTSGQRSDVPCDVVAPSDRLHPVNASETRKKN